MEMVELPLSAEENTIIKFALAELVNNSVRALHERKSEKDVVVSFEMSDNFIKVGIHDFGGGFDVKKLPHSLEKTVENVNMHAEEFQRYREKHGFKRFGIGLVSAKMVFDAFRLAFIDSECREIPWKGEGSVSGTSIIAAKKTGKINKKEEAVSVMRRIRRQSIFARARINEIENAFLLDISENGAHLLVFEENGFKEGGPVKLEILVDEKKKKSLVCDAIIRWIDRGSEIIRIGSEFVKNESFPEKDLRSFLDTMENEPKLVPGLVYIEGM